MIKLYSNPSSTREYFDGGTFVVSTIKDMPDEKAGYFGSYYYFSCWIDKECTEHNNAMQSLTDKGYEVYKENGGQRERE